MRLPFRVAEVKAIKDRDFNNEEGRDIKAGDVVTVGVLFAISAKNAEERGFDPDKHLVLYHGCWWMDEQKYYDLENPVKIVVK